MNLLERIPLTTHSKKMLATVVRFRPMRLLMHVAVILFAPRHRIGVGVVCLDQRGHVLLLKHVFHPQTPWGLPGGWLDRREAPATGVLRELYEETGLRATLDRVLLVNRSPLTHNIDIVYLAYAERDTITHSLEILDSGWFDPAALPRLFPDAQQAIATAVTIADNIMGTDER
jgi:ADP-ribose pyrophosphatase YjhB (NUDIX family)